MWPVYGIHLPVSIGPHRVIFLQDGKVGIIQAAPPDVRQDYATLPIQQDGYLGPAHLSGNYSQEFPVYSPEPTVADDEDFDDEFEDDGEDADENADDPLS